MATGAVFSFTSFNFAPGISQGHQQNKALLRSHFPSAKGAPGTEPCLATDATKGSVPVSLPSSGNPEAFLQGNALTPEAQRAAGRVQHQQHLPPAAGLQPGSSTLAEDRFLQI